MTKDEAVRRGWDFYTSLLRKGFFAMNVFRADSGDVFGRRQGKLYFRLMLWVVGWIYWTVSHLYFRLMRVTVIGEETFDRLQAQHMKGIAVPWHCHVVFGLWMGRNLGIAIMASRSNLGAVAAAITTRMRCIPIRGGSRDGGREALDQIVEYLREGHWALIVADAPRGPLYECKIGPVLAAQKSGVPIIPISFAAKRKWTLRTWDRMIIPKPFSRIVWVYGEPLYVSADLDREGLEQKRREVERVLRENQEAAEDYWGRGSRFLPRRDSGGTSDTD